MPKSRREPILELPPRIPEDGELARALMLLGCRCKDDLRASARAELIALVGRYPDAATAKKWKTALKQSSRDEIFRHTG